jgi:CheY-like chemotaxis protein
MARKKTILIIDDQPSTRLLLSHYLGTYYNVVEKSGAQDALEYLCNGPETDVIISDILMPGMTGIEFLNTYQKQRHLKISPVIVLSSVENSAERLKCFKHGARDFVLKPFNPEELHVRIKNVLTN